MTGYLRPQGILKATNAALAGLDEAGFSPHYDLTSPTTYRLVPAS
jgi:hypothetical protein